MPSRRRAQSLSVGRKTNSASGWMNLRTSQGHATRSTFTFSLVIHFISYLYQAAVDQAHQAGADHNCDDIPFPVHHYNHVHNSKREGEPVETLMAWKESIEAEPNREIHDHADDCGCDGGKRRVEP